MTADHFHNFAPADAVQYDGTNAGECIRFHKTFFIGYSGGIEHHLSPYGKASPGQWLVRQGSKVWVQDEEPARAERWEWATGRFDELTGAADEESARYWVDALAGITLHRRPVLSNGWTGPWSPVEGGAE